MDDGATDRVRHTLKPKIMGSFSVYCGISQIAITERQKCVLLVLKKDMTGETYMPYLAAALPIFGEYADYGDIGNVEEDANTKLIEEHFNCTIEDFCSYFTRGQYSPEDRPESVKNSEEMKKWKYMFIDREVYDFMSSYADQGWGGGGHLEFGNPEILKLLGFKFVKEDPNEERYNQEWERNGKTLYSDGYHTDVSMFYFFGKEDSFERFVGGRNKIPKDLLWVGSKSMAQLWQHLKDSDARSQLLYIIGLRPGRFDEMDVESFNRIMIESAKKKFLKEDGVEELSPERQAELDAIIKGFEEPEPTTLVDKYRIRFREFGDQLAGLTMVRKNLHPMSGYLAPYMPYVTPPCGEREHHQVLLDKFASIHRAILKAEDRE